MCEYNEGFYLQPGPKHLESVLLKLAHRLKTHDILDVGSGSGWLVKMFQENGFQAVGCDMSPLAVKDSLVVQGDATSLPFPQNSFDLVTAISLIEHLPHPKEERFLHEVRRVLRSKGYFFLITPNFGTPLRLVQGKGWHGYKDPTHVQFYTRSSLIHLLRRHGFRKSSAQLPLPDPDQFDWMITPTLYRLPLPLKKLLNYLAIATPLSQFRDSLSVLVQKTNNGRTDENQDFG